MMIDTIKCFFCGDKANIKEKDYQKIVICPQCKRETKMSEYQDMFDIWLGDIRNKDGEK
ncbi:MAG: hypothetical protein KJO26_07630 [Deltaproteobacteria bacterium]|nr:hypothetical protein [Deltaproteobacteria bacterium]